MGSLLGIAISALSVAIAGHPAFAQAPPQALPSTPGLADLLSNPGAWLNEMFHAALVSMGEKTTGDIVGFMNWLLQSGNVISQTPPALSYENEAVRDLSNSMQVIANG